MRRIDGWLRTATRALAVVGLLALFVNSLAVVADVVLRVLFASPIDRLSDISGMIFVVSAASCVPAAGRSLRARRCAPSLSLRPSTRLLQCVTT